MNGEPWSAHGLRGRRYGQLAPELVRRLPAWLEARGVPEGEPLPSPDVFRLGALVVKFFPQPNLLGWLRAPRAVRSAERHFWCQPLPSPRPLLAAGRPFRRASVLVREHVEGVTLRARWDEPGGLAPREEEALAVFLADMERHRVIHGDLHPRNLLWDGQRWLLLDVDGLRHGLHDPRRVLTDLWARLRLHLGDEARVRALFERACGELGGRSRVTWSEVGTALETMRARRGGVPPR